MTPQKSKKIPERLKRNGRPVVQEFDLREHLFQRFNELIEKGDYLYPAQIRFPVFSVNRELFSEPEDVLLPNLFDWGIAAFKVEDIPGEFVVGNESSTETVYNFVAVHVPEEENYSHSEVRTLINEVYKENKKIKNKEVKRNFRYNLGEKMIILRKPSIQKT